MVSLDATLTLSFASGQDIKDIANNNLTDTAPTGTNDFTFVVDNTAPTVTSIERRNLPCTEHFRATNFEQPRCRRACVTFETSLAAHPAKLYHSSFSAPGCRRAILARANERRD